MHNSSASFVDAKARKAIGMAVSGSTILIGISTLFGLIAAVPLAISLLIGHTRFSPAGHSLYFSLCFVGFFLPAALYLVACLNLVARKSWAAILGIVIATTHSLAGLVATGVTIALAKASGGYTLLLTIPALILCLGAGYTALCYWRAMRAMYLLADTSRAFEPILKSGSGLSN